MVYGRNEPAPTGYTVWLWLFDHLIIDSSSARCVCRPSAEYEQQDSYIGATVGRNASRIAGSQFQLDGITYKLAANSAGSHLHGGIRGFDKVTDRRPQNPPPPLPRRSTA